MPDEDEGVATLDCLIQFWSDKSFSKAELLQLDRYEATVTNLPTNKATYKGESEYLVDEDYTYYIDSRLYTPTTQELSSNTAASAEQYMEFILPRELRNRAEYGHEFSREDYLCFIP